MLRKFETGSAAGAGKRNNDFTSKTYCGFAGIVTEPQLSKVVPWSSECVAGSKGICARAGASARVSKASEHAKLPIVRLRIRRGKACGRGMAQLRIEKT